MKKDTVLTIEDLMKLVEQYAKDYNSVDGWSGKVLSSHILDKAYKSKNELKEALQILIQHQTENLVHTTNIHEKEPVQNTYQTPKVFKNKP